MSARKPRHTWTAKEEARLRRDYTNTPTRALAARLGLSDEQVYRKANQMGLKKSACYRKTRHSGCILPGERRGRATEFKADSVPHNKGKKFNVGGRSAETRFQAGHVPGNTLPIGTVVADSNVYLKQKIAHNRGRFGWRYLHHLVFEAAHGPLPAGHIVVFKDGDRRHVKLDNLACMSQAKNMHRNSIQRYPDALKKAIRAVAKLNKILEEKQS